MKGVNKLLSEIKSNKMAYERILSIKSSKEID